MAEAHRLEPDEPAALLLIEAADEAVAPAVERTLRMRLVCAALGARTPVPRRQ